MMEPQMPPLNPAALREAIRTIPDFPKPGIQFRDITPVLANGRLFASLIESVARPLEDTPLDAAIGIDARGFILAAAAAHRLRTGFVPVRKKGKLPHATYEESYALEYGANTVEVHIDAIRPGDRVILVDDLLATGGTAAAAVKLLRRLEAEIVEVIFFVELGFLEGRRQLDGLSVRSIVRYD